MSNLLFQWRRAVCSKEGPPPTTRHVLLTLSTHMDLDGGKCFPTTRRLAEETGLSERSVCTHLEKAAESGWLKRGKKGLEGRAWARTEYLAKIPNEALKEVQHLMPEGTETGSAPEAEGTERPSNKALKEVQSSSSYKNSSKKAHSQPEEECSFFPKWLDKSIWAEFKKMRQKMKAPMTDYAEMRMLNKLERFREVGHSPNEILNTSIENGWKGVFEPKKPSTTLPSPPPQAAYGTEGLYHYEN